MRTTPLFVVTGCLMLAACEKQPTRPAPSKAPTTPSQPVPAPSQPPAPPISPAPPAATGQLAVMGVSFPVPAGWVQAPPANSMRLAELHVPDAAGNPAKRCTAVFSTAGGTVQGNLDRWAGQFQAADGKPATPEVKTREVAGLKISTLVLTGTYAGMGDSPAMPDWTLRGAVIETSEGLLFIKMTGPAAEMTAAGPAFETLLTGLSRKDR